MHSDGKSEWTPEAYRLREEARLSGERPHGYLYSKASDSTNSAPIVISDRTSEAFQQRKNERLHSEYSSPLQQNAETQQKIFAYDTAQRDNGSLLSSDWTLSAYQARENKRKRDEFIFNRINEKAKFNHSTGPNPAGEESRQNKFLQNKNKADQFFKNRLASSPSDGVVQSTPAVVNILPQETDNASPYEISGGSEQGGSVDANLAGGPVESGDFNYAENTPEVAVNQNFQSLNADSSISVGPEVPHTPKDMWAKSSHQATSGYDINYADDLSLDNRGRIFFAAASLSGFMLLLWIISHFALPLYLKTSYPDLSLKLNSTSPAFLRKLNNYVSALIEQKRANSPQNNLKSSTSENLQEKSFTQGKNSPTDEFSKMIARSRSVLAVDPLNGEHYRILGQLNDAVGNNDLAYVLMKSASDISSKEIIAHDYIFRTNLINKHTDIALLYADRLFTIFHEAIPYYAPSFGLMIQDDHSRESLVKLLVKTPHWRNDFFSQIVPKLTDSRNDEISALFAALHKTPAPPTNNELKYFVSSLIVSGKYHLAYKMLVSLLPPEYVKKSVLINNGGFDVEPTGLPFDWSVGGGKEARAQITTIDGTDNRVLNIEFGNGRVAFPNITQLMVLNPGNYLIEGKYKGEAIGKRGLFWIVNCYRGKRIGESGEIRGKFLDWRAFQFEIKIPEENCVAQGLSLLHGARSPSEQILSGSISFDDIKITSIKHDN